MTPVISQPEFSTITPATDMRGVWRNFDPHLLADPKSRQYIERKDAALQKLINTLEYAPRPIHAFLCGHQGSGKTTELKRIYTHSKIQRQYIPVYLTAKDLGGDLAHLTVDAVFLEIGRKLLELADETDTKLLPQGYADELDKWGQQIVKTFLGNQQIDAETGAKAGWWLAYFRAQLKSRREWKIEQRQMLEPKIQDLIDIIQRMAQELKNNTQKTLLVLVDDLEKGESDLHKEMHTRLFQENYDFLVQPSFAMIYTLPVYFRAMPGRWIPNDQVYAFSAVRLYENSRKKSRAPRLDKAGAGYRLMRDFVETRIENPSGFFGEDDLDEMLLIGGGLFRETARCIQEAAYSALTRGASRIEAEDVKRIFNAVKKEYQPMIRGGAIRILNEVDETEQGWVEGVEPYLQSRAVVEYENGDLWLDLRYVLKDYVRKLAGKDQGE